MHAIAVLISTLCTGRSIFRAYYFYFVLVSITLFRLERVATRVADHTCACRHMCKNGGYRYFKRLCPVVISNSNPLSEYWHKYPTLKLSSMSHSSALIMVCMIKNNFNSAYCPCLIVTGSTSD